MHPRKQIASHGTFITVSLSPPSLSPHANDSMHLLPDRVRLKNKLVYLTWTGHFFALWSMSLPVQLFQSMKIMKKSTIATKDSLNKICQPGSIGSTCRPIDKLTEKRPRNIFCFMFQVLRKLLLKYYYTSRRPILTCRCRRRRLRHGRNVDGFTRPLLCLA